jgi:hypothetical protein
MKKLEETILFKHFERIATPEQVTLVTSNTKKAADRLFLVRDTFPTYTLHNEQHVLNVIDLMEKILGERIDNLDPLEYAILILGAYYHDIGMVFTNNERESIQNEIEFEHFIRKYPKAHLRILEFQDENPANNNQIPEDVAEWYCRWIHPDRSANYVNNHTELLWKNFPINDSIAAICKSHGYSIVEVYKWNSISTDFLGRVDLLFCSIILRLADILDFDNSRSPEEVYNYLGLSKRNTKRDSISDVEWLKHLCSLGFIFTSTNRNDRYPIKFASAPDEPAVEYDVREFLNTIESELDICNATLKFCSSRWQNFHLPLTINRSDIKSKGYTYGEFRFTLQQDQILNLLMGENLYSDPYAFVRELVQNAIDTTRHREIYEISKGNVNFISQPIVFSTWNDSDGYTWLRIDDSGMGMNEEIISNYFLKVGQSYYNSEQFKVEQINLRAKSNIDFMPISRFGIGILSCFIIGDQIELSSRRVTVTPERNALRMTMSGLSSFFVLKKESEKHTCIPMPNQHKSNETYRGINDFGTSISIRLNSKKDRADFNLKNILNGYIVVSPVQIKYNEEIIGGNYNELIENEWCKYAEYTMKESEQIDIENAIDVKFSEPLKIVFSPLNLTGNSPNKKFKGQAIVGYVKYPPQNINAIYNSSDSIKRDIYLKRNDSDGKISLHVKYENRDILNALQRKYGYNFDEEYYESIRRKLRHSLERIERMRGNSTANLIYHQIRDMLDGGKIQSLSRSNEVGINFFPNKKELIKKALQFKKLADTSQSFAIDEFESFCENISSSFGDDAGYSLYKYVDAIRHKDHVFAEKLWNRFNNSIPEFVNKDSVNQELQLIYDEAISFTKFRDEYKNAKREFSINLDDLSIIFNEKFKQIKLHWLSHNGIYVPTKDKDNFKLNINCPIQNSFIYYNLALMDSLRPDLSISRDELRGLNWNIYSTINYSFSKSLSSLKLPDLIIKPDIFSNIYDHSSFLFGNLHNDPLLTSNKFWAVEKIFRINSQLYSLVDLRESVKKKENILFELPIEVHKTYNCGKYESSHPSFLQYCKAALVQIGLNVELNAKADKLIIVDENIPIFEEHFKYYPPLFFIKYKNEKHLRNKNNPINSCHPFAKWLIKNSEILFLKYPGLLERIRASISKDIIYDWNNECIKTIISEINSILKRLDSLNFDDRPVKGIYLKEEDFVIV